MPRTSIGAPTPPHAMAPGKRTEAAASRRPNDTRPGDKCTHICRLPPFPRSPRGMIPGAGRVDDTQPGMRPGARIFEQKPSVLRILYRAAERSETGTEISPTDKPGPDRRGTGTATSTAGTEISRTHKPGLCGAGGRRRPSHRGHTMRGGEGKTEQNSGLLRNRCAHSGRTPGKRTKRGWALDAPQYDAAADPPAGSSRSDDGLEWRPMEGAACGRAELVDLRPRPPRSPPPSQAAPLLGHRSALGYVTLL